MSSNFTVKMTKSIKNVFRWFIHRNVREDDKQVMKEPDSYVSASKSDELNFNNFKMHYNKPYRPLPNIASWLIAMFIILVFAVLPVIYLLHCFGLLGTWTPRWKHSQVSNHHNLFTVAEKHKAFSMENVKCKSNVTTKDKIVATGSPHLGLPLPAGATDQQCFNIEDNLKFDCYPQNGANEASCKARGCCWAPKNTYTVDIPLDIPYCFYPSNYGGYKWTNISETKTGLVAYLQRTFQSFYPDDVLLVRVDIKYESSKRIRIKLSDASHSRFEPPYPEVPLIDKSSTNNDYSFVLDSKKSGFKVLRKSDNKSIFDTQEIGGMIFADQFLQISSLLPSDYIYGLGEHSSTFLLNTQWQMFTMWNHDSIPKENTNLYGSHPFYLCLEKSGASHGVFLLNSNAMDIILQPAPAITFRAIGGILDFYIFLGPTPTDVVEQYTQIIGKPYMPPLWSLGFHLCRFGYKTLNKTREVWNRTVEYGIPFDVQWNDLDYMNNSNDFTYDKVNFKDLPEFVNELHSLGMKYTVLIDPGVSSAEKKGTYPPFDDGVKMDIFVKNSSGQPFEGKVWNGVSTVWPDFSHPSSVDYWIDQIGNMHKEFEFDGAWIDMNEPSNFYSGSKHGCPDNKLENPPYLPGVDGGLLYYKSLCMSSTQYAGTHYNVHNLYGFTEAIVTSFAMSEIRGKRPFVISRSTFPGHGHFAGHWTGDVVSTWIDMKKSIPQILNMNMFGIPLVGADICGFNGNTTASLCNRWSQLGAFYPFSRNHNTDDGIEQDPVALGEDVAQSAKNSLLIRYSLLPYLYTLFYEAHISGSLVARPMLFEFPQDPLTYPLDEQFLLGPALLVVPVLEPDQLEVNPYLPKSNWYDFYSLGMIPESGTHYKLQAPIHRIPLLLRGGHIIPRQKPEATTAATRINPIELMAMPDEQDSAEGSLFWDDGDTMNNVEDGINNLLKFTLKGARLSCVALHWGYDRPLVLSKVAVLGVKLPVTTVYVEQASKPFSYDTINKVLLIENLHMNMKKNFTIHWI